MRAIKKDLECEFYEVLNEIIEFNGTLIKLHKGKIYLGSNDVEITADVSVEVFDTKKQYQDNKPSSVFVFVCWSMDCIMKQFDYYEIITKFKQSELGHKLYIVSQKGFSQEVVLDCSFDKVGLIKFPTGSFFSDFIVPRILEREENKELLEILKGKDEKKPYLKAELEVSRFEGADIVTASGGDDSPYSPDEDLGMWG